MLTSVLEINKAFDETLKKSIPYLIFTHREYRERLVDLLNGFCQYHRENNQLAFTERYNTIHNFLSECETDGFDTFTTLNIHYLATYQKSLHQIHFDTENRIRALEADVTALKKRRPSSSKKQEADLLPVVEPHPEIPVVDKIPAPIDPKSMTPEQKMEALIQSFKLSIKPLDVLTLCKLTGLSDNDVRNYLDRKLVKNNFVVKIQHPLKRETKGGTVGERKRNYFIWKENIPTNGIIPEPDDGEFTPEKKKKNDLPVQ